MTVEIKKAKGAADGLRRKKFLEKIESSMSTESLEILSSLTVYDNVNQKLERYKEVIKSVF